MKVLRLLSLAVMLGVAFSASAQFKMGVKGGLNLSDFVDKEYGLSSNKMLLGGQVGVVADYEFRHNMAIQTGLMFISKGLRGTIVGTEGLDKITIDNIDDIDINNLAETEWKYRQRPVYIQLPLHYAYKWKVQPDFKIVFHGGVFAAYGLMGKSRTKLGTADEKSMDLFGKDNALKRFDAGWGIGVGAEFGKYLIDLGFDLGFIDVSNRELAGLGGGLTSETIYLSVGYRF